MSRVPIMVQVLAVVLCAGGAFPSAESDEEIPRIADRTRGLERRSGLLDLYVDAPRGKMWLRLPPPGDPSGRVGELLYMEGLRVGLGSNPVGLDRGQLGPARLIRIRRLGSRVLIEQPNLGFRALGAGEIERNAVDESFATSVLWAGEVAALDRDGSALVDLQSFLVRDAHGIRTRLRSAGQGDFVLDENRSAIDLSRCLVFPRNLEFESVLTFAGEDPGSHVRSVTPDPESVTLVLHQSLVALPGPGYRTRPYDPRAGSFAVSFQDYSVPVDATIERSWIVRHRLRKVHPERERSRVVRPIVYYVDRAAPEPIRGALVDGARWWAEAFEEAGFLDAFRVELLPEDVHPLDVRYHVIQWVHRSTRGWSYGGGVVDPRTGEMIKAHVSLGSLRVRQDRRIFEGMLGTGSTGTGRPDDPVQLALARLRQLSAHEVGHTLGLTHNFAASTYDGRASVMDYPAPLLDVGPDDRINVSQAYGIGVGTWDRHALLYAYAEPVGDDDARGRALERILVSGMERGLLFLSDEDARPDGAAHPLANLWDNGADPVDELARVMRVRRHALLHFDTTRTAIGSALSSLEEVFATVYFYHRYQLRAAARSIGGVIYRHDVRGGRGGAPIRSVPYGRQRDALAALLDALAPEVLDVPDAALGWLVPRVPGQAPNRERFGGRTAPTFDALSAAATAADLVLRELLQPERCARLVDQHRRDPSLPGLEELLERTVARLFENEPAEPRAVEILREVQRTFVSRLIGLAADARASGGVRARVEATLDDLRERLSDSGERADPRRMLAREIARYLDRPETGYEPRLPSVPAPPGSPIGQGLDPGACSRAGGQGSGAAQAPRGREHLADASHQP